MSDFDDVTHLLFDHDGVLVDTEFWYFLATQRQLAEAGIELSLEQYMDHMVTGRSVWMPLIDEASHDSFRTRRNDLYADYLQTQDIQIPGVENVLASLHGKYPMAVVTTSRPEHFNLIHEQRNIRSFFEFVLAKGDYARSKPEPDPYEAALARFGIAPEQALVIEDSERGLRSAVAAGIRCVVVKNEFTQDQDFSAATARIDHITELPTLLGRRLPGIHGD